MIRVLAAAICLFLGFTAARAETGIASVYSYGPRTANGERFDPRGLTAAHKTLPFGTLVTVCRVLTGKTPGNCIVVRINDRGPYVRGRIIDLTPPGAKALGFSARGAGLAHVTVDVLSLGAIHAAHARHRARHRVVQR